jgi:hypothetical protein
VIDVLCSAKALQKSETEKKNKKDYRNICKTQTYVKKERKGEIGKAE